MKKSESCSDFRKGSRGASRAAFVTAAVFSLAVTIAGGAAAQSDAAVGRLYLEGALRLRERGELFQARALVDTALEFAPGDPDILFLSAMLMEETGESALASLEYAREALGLPAWRSHSRSDGLFFVSRLLYRLRRYEEVVSTLREIPVSSLSPAPHMELLVAALARAGRTREAFRQLERALAVHPADPRFRVLRMRHFGPPSIDDADFLARRIQESDDYWDAVLTYCETAPGTTADRFLSEYFASGRGSARALLIGMEASGADKGRIERFLEAGGGSDFNILSRLRRLLAPAESAWLDARLAEKDFTAVYDKDGDGFPEVWYVCQGGRLVEIRYDLDQDGVSDILIGLDQGRPRHVVYAKGGEGSLTVEYGLYPSVERIVLRDGGMTSEYRVDPTSARLESVFASLPIALFDEITVNRLAEPLPLLRLTIEATTKKNGLPVRIMRYEDGQPLYLEQSLDEDGVMNRRVFFQAGQPLRGERDMDKDGFFETREEYRSGRLEAISFLSPIDGRTEFWQNFGEPMLRFWDFNRDGRVDAAEYRIGRDQRLRVFSDELDNLFADLAIDRLP